MKRLFCWLFTILILNLTTAWADELSDYEIVHLSEQLDGNPIYKEIRFVKKMTREIIKTFNIRAKNPYQNLSLPTTQKYYTPAIGFKVYDLTKVDRARIFKELLPSVQGNAKSQYYFEVAFTELDPGSSMENTNFTVINYDLRVRSNDEESYPALSTTIVLNAKGEELLRLKNTGMDCISPLVTSNGKYLAFQYGQYGPIDQGPGYIGIRVYEISSGKIIVDKIVTSGEGGISGPIETHGKVCFELHRAEKSKFLFYDLDKRTVFSKEWPFNERNALTTMEPDGCVFEIPSSGRKFYRFETDFKKEALR